MAEGGKQTHIYNVTAQSVQIVGQNIGKVNIKDSYIHEIEGASSNYATDATHKDRDQVSHCNVEEDSAARIPNESSPGASDRMPAFNEQDWVKLTDKIYMCEKERLKSNSHVYKGKQYFAGKWRDVAIKFIPYNDKWFNEINFHLKLEEHPNIIKIIEANETRQGPIPYIYIVMELCSQTLKEFIEENKKEPFDFKQRFSYAKQIISGVAFIHRKNILHRDIKPENILLTPSKDFIRVADFGLSKEIESGKSVDLVSSRGLGSDGYMAPEMHHEIPKASFRSDSFAIGVVLSMLFSNGKHPFGSDPFRWRTNILDNKGLDLSKIFHFGEPLSHKRDQLLDLLRCTLSQNPEKRPTPSEMLEYPFFNDSSGEERKKKPVSWGKRLKKFLSSRRLGENPPSDRLDWNSESTATAAATPGQVTQSELANPSSLLIAQTPSSARPSWTEVTAEPGENDKSPDIPKGYTREERIKFLEDKLQIKPFHRYEYEKSIGYLQELRTLRGKDDLDCLLLLVEFHLHLKSGEEESSIANVLNFLLTPGAEQSADNVKKIADDYFDGKRYVRATILYKISHKIHRKEKPLSPDNELTWIHDRIRNIKRCIEPMVKAQGKSRVFANEYGLKYMENMLKHFREVKNAHPHRKTLKELECLGYFDGIYDINGEYEKSISKYEEAHAIMKQQFGDDVVTHKGYGWLLNNLGVTYEKLNQFSKAEHYYTASIEAKEKARNYKNEEERQEDINMTRENLHAICRKIGNQT